MYFKHYLFLICFLKQIIVLENIFLMVLLGVITLLVYIQMMNGISFHENDVIRQALVSDNNSAVCTVHYLLASISCGLSPLLCELLFASIRN